MLLGLGSPVGAATTTTIPAASSMVLSIAEYAVATATHDRPAHVVSAADVNNAVATLRSLNSQLALQYNLGNLLGAPQQIAFFDGATYKFICADFPGSIGRQPKIVPCSSKATATWETLPFVLIQSRKAVATAASHGRAVAGADVVAAIGSGSTTSLAPKPTFLAGQGGKARFVTKVKMGTTTFTFVICVKFPKTAYGIPLQVAC